MFTIDGIQWNVKCKIQRTAKMEASNISGMMLNKQYFADVIGTYLVYKVTLAVPFGREDEYSRLYEKLTEPVGDHTIVAPYNQADVTINGRIESVSDTHIRRTSGDNYWMEVSFSLISNSPTKEMSLDEVISRGFAPLPDEASVSIGSAYQYTSSGWAEMADAEDSYY